MEWTNLEESSSFKPLFLWDDRDIRRMWLLCKWCNDLIEIDLQEFIDTCDMHACKIMNKIR